MTATSTSVPLMADVEGQNHLGEYHDDVDGGGGEDIKNDFAYRNNVAGAQKHIRMGRFT